MLITCDGCNSKIRVPDGAAGKRVKCPKCATLIRVPTVEPTESANPESAGVSSTPLPPPPELEQAKEETPAESDGTEVTSTPSSSGSKPPVIKKSDSAAWDDDDDEDGDEDDGDRKRKRRKRDDDDNDDDLSVRKRRRPARSPQTNPLAMTSMILGIVAVVFSLPGCFPTCCCGLFTAVAGVCGIAAIITGFVGKTPGSESMAMTGIICGSVALGILLLGVILFFVGMAFNFGMFGFNNF